IPIVIDFSIVAVNAHCCQRYESCDCKLVDAKIFKEYNVDNNGHLTATSEVDNNGIQTKEILVFHTGNDELLECIQPQWSHGLHAFLSDPQDAISIPAF
ncbi:hypothetical protein C0J52_17086, partial [Blattella germanica]